MSQKVFRAFGYIIVQNNWDRGEIFSDDYCTDNVFYYGSDVNPLLTKEEFDPKDFNHIWFFTRGSVETTSLETGDKKKRESGFCTYGANNQGGWIKMEVLEPTTMFCLSANRNLNRIPIIPHVKPFILKSGECFTPSSPTKLFFAEGTMNCFGVDVKSACQINLNPDNKIIAITDCYGLEFHNE